MMVRDICCKIVFSIVILYVFVTYVALLITSGDDEDTSPTFYALSGNQSKPMDRSSVAYRMFQRWNGTHYGGVDDYIQYNVARLGLKTLVRSRPVLQQADFGPIINDVTSFKYPINIPPCSKSLQVFVMVISAPGYFDKRQIIRQTWVRHLDSHQVNVAFIVGQTSNATIQKGIEEESDHFGDVIQVEMADTYFNLPFKTVAYLNWVHKYCPAVPFVLKCDDDVFVNVHNLATVLQSLPPDEPAIYGGYNVIERVNRNKRQKWYITHEVWPWFNYPPYVYGGSYLISRSAIGPLLAAAQVTPYFVFEDVYLIALCARKANVFVLSSDRIFILNIDCSYNPFCALKHVTWLTDTPEQMIASNRNVEKFYHFKKYTQEGSIVPLPMKPLLDFSFKSYEKETIYRLLE